MPFSNATPAGPVRKPQEFSLLFLVLVRIIRVRLSWTISCTSSVRKPNSEDLSRICQQHQWSCRHIVPNPPPSSPFRTSIFRARTPQKHARFLFQERNIIAEWSKYLQYVVMISHPAMMAPRSRTTNLVFCVPNTQTQTPIFWPISWNGYNLSRIKTKSILFCF